MMLREKVCVITGGATGIGRATAIRMMEEGAIVHIVGHDRQAVEAAAREIGAIAHMCDIRDAGAVKALFEELGHVDVLVANAAVSFTVDVMHDSESRWREMLETNMWGTIHTCLEAGKRMVERGGGHIVIVSSILSRMAEIGSAPYAMSKAAVSQLGRQLAVEWAHHGVHVNVVAPGCVQTPMSFASGENEFETEWFKRFFVNPERPRIPIARPGRPEEIAEGILFFANPRNSYCTGQVLEIDGGLTIKY